MNFVIRKIGLLLLVATALVAKPAYAQSMVVETDPFTFPIVSTQTPQSTINLSFAGFNTALGTLTSVTINLTNVVVQGSATMQNNTGSTQDIYTIYLQGGFQLTDTASAQNTQLTVNTPTVGGGTFNPIVVPTGDTFFLGGGNTSTVSSNQPNNPPAGVTQVTSASTNGTGTTIATNLSNYTGTSTTIHMTLQSVYLLNLSDSAAFNEAATGGGTGDATITFNYTAVPEPGQTAAWLLGFALCVMGGRKYFQLRTRCLA